MIFEKEVEGQRSASLIGTNTLSMSVTIMNSVWNKNTRKVSDIQAVGTNTMTMCNNVRLANPLYVELTAMKINTYLIRTKWHRVISMKLGAICNFQQYFRRYGNNCLITLHKLTP